MNYNYLMDAFDGSIGCEVNNSDLANSTTIYNGRVKNDLTSNNDIRTISHFQQPLKYNNVGSIASSGSPEPHFDDKKLRFSEKLKVLLKHGGNKNEKVDSTDPYAFSEIDLQYSGPISKALNKVDSYFGKTMPANVKTNNVTLQKSIMFSKSGMPHASSKNLTEEKDCNGDAVDSFNKNVKLNKTEVPIYAAANNAVITNLNSNAYKFQTVNQMDKFKLSTLNNGNAVSPVQLPANNKPIINKDVGKSKFQKLKPSIVNNSLKMNKNSGGKPFAFAQSQVQKQLNVKAEKKTDNKLKNSHKGKSLLNQLQKTALLNRPGNSPARKNSSKSPLFGMSKSTGKDMETSVPSNSFNRNTNKKSLLEESLLGIKTHGNNKDKDLNNGTTLKSRTTEADFTKGDYSGSLTETGSVTVLSPPKSRTDSLDQGKHESLQRIWDIRNKLKGLKRDHHHFGLTINDGDYDENSNSECLLFQNYWFSVCNGYDSISNNDRRRDTKLSQLKIELRHKIKQLQWRYKDEYRDKVVELLVDSARKQPNLTAFLIRLENSKFNSRKKNARVKPFNLLKPVLCTYTNPESGEKCEEQAMPCVKFCQQHITCSNDQLLFTACSALRNDNTTCRAAVLNQNSENPLCFQHKRLVNLSEIPKKLGNSKPVNRSSQSRKRSRSFTGSSNRSGRNRKRKRTAQKDKREGLNDSVMPSSVRNDSSTNFNFGKNDESNDSFKRRNALTKINPQVISKCDIDESQEVEVGEEVLAIAADLPLDIATQATKLLEEHDFTNVLNHIPADAFNDLFTEDKEEYEPTPQETEELERALEAVDKDVKSLEKLSQTQGILDTLLDEQTIAQTLAQLPEVTASLEVPQTLVPVFYQNGFSNVNQLEQTLQDVNKSLTQTVLLNQGTGGISNHFVNNITIPVINNITASHADVLQS